MSRKKFGYRDLLRIVMGQMSVAHFCGHQWPVILCGFCNQPIRHSDIDAVELDHGDAVGFGEGRDEPDNCSFMHESCHKTKTAQDKARMAKADRQGGRRGSQTARRERNGAQIRSGGFSTNRNSAWKKPMHGNAVRRDG